MPGEKKQNIFSPSKNFLLPFILLMLSRMSLHGYELIQKLSSLGFPALDQGNIYRMLRKLEKESLVCSEWDTSGPGPAKRLYSITDSGKSYLKTYANQLESYQSLLDQFFNMYSSIFELYVPSLYKQEEKIEKSKQKDGEESS